MLASVWPVYPTVRDLQRHGGRISSVRVPLQASDRSSRVDQLTSASKPLVVGDANKGFRVSRYFGDEDGPPQVRFSVWSETGVTAAISLTSDEAARLAQFIAPPHARKPLLDQIRESLRI